ncbi:protein-L-isoaspartate(D-aspartate) O-methyltransferase [Halobacterium zhouii]|uniref:protein-L-isoaspartate(D-aspartate) O-methyltransferase n=1 Tax=Halobacterium zhouii TaxID=2902624 RepID=UPI001E4181A8|nr:protein-L-isoaspartate(D-aspartate) O-methyltransferase [Halobacterium zhouii]
MPDGRGGTDDGRDDAAAAREALADALAERPNVSERAADAIRAVPRHEFVPSEQRDAAYDDRPLPIGNGQTISAPHMVAIMATDLGVQDGDSVIEIGAGCGYHAAVTAELVGSENVYSVEYDSELAENARETLTNAGYGDVSIRTGDGRDGWPERAPFDAAYATCAVPDFPDAVVEQVRGGGVLLAPVGDGRQRLVRATKRSDGSIDREDRGGVRFVRMRG